MLSCTEEFAATSFQVNRFTLVMKSYHYSDEVVSLRWWNFIILVKRLTWRCKSMK